MSEEKKQQLPLVSAEVAFHALQTVVGSKPWFPDYQKHMDAHKGFEILSYFIQNKHQEEKEKVHAQTDELSKAV